MSTLTQQEIATPDTERKSNKVRSQSRFTATRYLTYTAMFAAIAIIIKFVSQYLTFGSFKVTLIYTVWMIAGAVLGPLAGGTVCFVSDVLGAFILPVSGIIPLVTAANTVYGVLGALVYRYTPSKSHTVRFLAEGIVCTAVCTLFLNSLALWHGLGFYKAVGFWAYLGGERLIQLAVAAINVAITVSMIPLLTKQKMLPVYKKSTAKSDENKEESTNA